MSEKSPSPKSAARPDEDLLLDLNFVPKWAKKEPGANHYQIDESRHGRHDRRDRRDGPPRRDRRDGPPRSDRRDGPPRSDRRNGPPRSDRRPPMRGGESAPRRDAPPRPRRVDLPVEIKFLPEQKRLASLVRQIHHSKRAYPADRSWHIFSYPIRAATWSSSRLFPMIWILSCIRESIPKWVATNRDDLLRQLLDEHLEDFFVKEEIEVEAPSGVFPMIGKIDDILVGPPNHHSYAERLAEIHRNRYAGMPFDRFKQRVQTVRDEELIEQWKQESSKKTVYRLKKGDQEKEFTLVQAEDYVRNHIADAEIEEVTRAVLPSSLARRVTDYNLIRMVREAWQQESRFPISLSFAMRAAFRHLHLYTFKAGKNINFITAVKPDPIAPEAAVENIRLVLEYLGDHPGSTRQQLVEGLRPGGR